MGFRLTWQEDNVAEAGHRVYRDTAPMDPSALPTPIAELGPDVTHYDDGAVTPGQTYYYRVSAFTSGGAELVSDEIEALAQEA